MMSSLLLAVPPGAAVYARFTWHTLPASYVVAIAASPGQPHGYPSITGLLRHCGACQAECLLTQRIHSRAHMHS